MKETIFQNPVLYTTIITAVASIITVIIATINSRRSIKIKNESNKEIEILKTENMRLNTLIKTISNENIAESKNNTDISIAKIQAKEKLELLKRAETETQPIIDKIMHVWELLQRAKEHLNKFNSSNYFNVSESKKELIEISDYLVKVYSEIGSRVVLYSEKTRKILHDIKGNFGSKLFLIINDKDNNEEYTYVATNENRKEIQSFHEWITEHQELLASEQRKLENKRYNDLLALFEDVK
jgi:hypothetical protein